MKTLVLGMGNELLGDDAVGVVAARRLRQRIPPDIEIIETALHGLALIDLLTGYDQLVILDSIRTGTVPPGTIFEMGPHDLRSVAVPSPHYAGLPEMIALASRLELDFPSKITIFAVEIENADTLGKPLSLSVEDAVDDLVGRAAAQLKRWQSRPARADDN